MNIKSILATVAAVPAFALGFLGCDTAAHATPTPETANYVVTDDESTAVDMGFPYRDNVDYELDHLAEAETLTDDRAYCEYLTLRHSDGYLYSWYECFNIPVNELPRTPEWS